MYHLTLQFYISLGVNSLFKAVLIKSTKMAQEYEKFSIEKNNVITFKDTIKASEVGTYLKAKIELGSCQGGRRAKRAARQTKNWLFYY